MEKNDKKFNKASFLITNDIICRNKQFVSREGDKIILP